MQATVSLWGNSLGVRIPQKLAKEINILQGDVVDFKIENDSLVIKKQRVRKTLKEIIGENPPPYESEWVDWGKPEGDEIW